MIIYALALIVAIGMAVILQFIFNIPFAITLAVAAVILIVRAIYNIYMTYKCKDLSRLEKFLQKSPNTLNYFFFTQKNGTIDEQTAALDDVLKSYSSPIVQGQYKAYQAILTRNYQQAVVHAKAIPNTVMRNETLAFVEATCGKRSAAEQLAIGKPWFKAFIFAIIAYRAKDMTAFEKYKQQCLDNCAGAQYFSNTYFLARLHEYVKK